ncbi:hypothetical protein [Psittacicella hinzii]|uniref:Uncharacterized protein n=1 Tax=Psittacicella hinzii TaxID=2028575 RepID=A0A3A1YF90_9GAMM|nr:hypothetical protein [Psittacicella hinzii]RIY34894.1 hypothetical protein CKF58_07400 [Psittacicella hinzii]
MTTNNNRNGKKGSYQKKGSKNTNNNNRKQSISSDYGNVGGVGVYQEYVSTSGASTYTDQKGKVEETLAYLNKIAKRIKAGKSTSDKEVDVNVSNNAKTKKRDNELLDFKTYDEAVKMNLHNVEKSKNLKTSSVFKLSLDTSNSDLISTTKVLDNTNDKNRVLSSNTRTVDNSTPLSVNSANKSNNKSSSNQGRDSLLNSFIEDVKSYSIKNNRYPLTRDFVRPQSSDNVIYTEYTNNKTSYGREREFVNSLPPQTVEVYKKTKKLFHDLNLVAKNSTDDNTTFHNASIHNVEPSDLGIMTDQRRAKKRKASSLDKQKATEVQKIQFSQSSVTSENNDKCDSLLYVAKRVPRLENNIQIDNVNEILNDTKESDNHIKSSDKSRGYPNFIPITDNINSAAGSKLYVSIGKHHATRNSNVTSMSKQKEKLVADNIELLKNSLANNAEQTSDLNTHVLAAEQKDNENRSAGPKLYLGNGKHEAAKNSDLTPISKHKEKLVADNVQLLDKSLSKNSFESLEQTTSLNTQTSAASVTAKTELSSSKTTSEFKRQGLKPSLESQLQQDVEESPKLYSRRLSRFSRRQRSDVHGNYDVLDPNNQSNKSLADVSKGTIHRQTTNNFNKNKVVAQTNTLLYKKYIVKGSSLDDVTDTCCHIILKPYLHNGKHLTEDDLLDLLEEL